MSPHVIGRVDEFLLYNFLRAAGYPRCIYSVSAKKEWERQAIYFNGESTSSKLPIFAWILRLEFIIGKVDLTDYLRLWRSSTVTKMGQNLESAKRS